MPNDTNKPLSLGRRWEAYRPTKGVWFWSSAGCIVATIVVGFVWGGWVMGGTATRMASDAPPGHGRSLRRWSVSPVSIRARMRWPSLLS